MGYKAHLRQKGYNPTVPMRDVIDAWWGWYVANNSWYYSEERSASDRRTYKVERLSIKPARMVCQEWASLLLNERTVISCEDEATNAWLADYIETSSFLYTGQRLVERAFALGTGAWALRFEGIAEGATYSPTARIVVQRFDARQIIPLTYDEDTCTECAFLSAVVIGGKKLDQLQMHRIGERGTYVIETAFFDARGVPVKVDAVAESVDTGSTMSPFALVRPGLENTYWDYSPFGVSVFDDALGAVKLTDTAVDNMHRDIWLGQKMLFLDERMLETDANGRVVVPRAKDQQLFRKTETDGSSALIEEYNPDLRIADNRLALDAGLDLLAARVGLGAGYYASGAQGVSSRTATEVIAEQSDLFRNLRKHENAMTPAIKTITAAIIDSARNIIGLPLPDAGAITVRYDDSIIEDTDAMRRRDLTDIAAGLMQPWEYRAKWYGEDEATARTMVTAEPLPPAE